MENLEELTRRKQQAPAIGTLAYILFGPAVWALQLTVVYGGHTLICTGGVPDSLAPILVQAATGVVAITLLAFLVGQRRAARVFGLLDDTAGRSTYDSLSRIAGILSMIAIIWTGGTASIVTACVQAR